VSARESWTGTLAWNPARPDTVIISCVDGRWRPHLLEFAMMRLGVGPNGDFMAVPGGVEPLTLLDLIPKDFNFFRRRLDALVEAHGTKRIVLVAHQDCAWYKSRKFGPITIDVKERQIKDLKRAEKYLRETFPGTTVESWYARHDETLGAKVVFDPV